MIPHAMLYGPQQLEIVLVALENFMGWEAEHLSWRDPGQMLSLLSQDHDILKAKLEQLTPLVLCSLLQR